MATDNLIEPFPSNIDRDGFGHWLSGFTDGEGCFQLLWVNRYNHQGRATPAGRFSINLRLDDRPALKLIQSFLGCGNIFMKCNRTDTGTLPQATFQVSAIKSLASIVVPHFDCYPLIAKKARDYVIWKQAILFLAQPRLQVMRNRTSPSKYSESEWEHFDNLRNALRLQRRFESPPAVAVPAPAEEKGLFD